MRACERLHLCLESGLFEMRTQSLKQRKPLCVRGLWERGAGDETRTRDIFLGKEVLYQLSYTRANERWRS
jgi:hypothetical protein